MNTHPQLKVLFILSLLLAVPLFANSVHIAYALYRKQTYVKPTPDKVPVILSLSAAYSYISSASVDINVDQSADKYALIVDIWFGDKSEDLRLYPDYKNLRKARELFESLGYETIVLSEHNATFANILKAIIKILEAENDASDRVVFIFASHGYYIGHEWYDYLVFPTVLWGMSVIMTYDEYWISTLTLLVLFNLLLDSKNVFLLFDACLQGGMKRIADGKTDVVLLGNTWTPVSFGDQEDGRIVVTSSSESTYGVSSATYGFVFLYYFLTYLPEHYSVESTFDYVEPIYESYNVNWTLDAQIADNYDGYYYIIYGGGSWSPGIGITPTGYTETIL